MLYYIITNRQILKNTKTDYIKSDDRETPSENLPFVTFDPDTSNASNDSCKLVTLFVDASGPQQKDVMTDLQVRPHKKALSKANEISFPSLPCRIPDEFLFDNDQLLGISSRYKRNSPQKSYNGYYLHGNHNPYFSPDTISKLSYFKLDY